MKNMTAMIMALLTLTPLAQATTCVRTDSDTVVAMNGVVSAEIMERHANFDSRIRFYDENNEQLETCSTDLGSEHEFNCWTRAGMQGEDDEISYHLSVDSKTLNHKLHNIRGRFTLKVEPLDENSAATFECSN